MIGGAPVKFAPPTVVGQFDCHPEQASFAQRGIWASRAKRRVLCDALIARLARFLIKLTHTPPTVAACRVLCLNRVMFARKIRVQYEDHGQELNCPVKWLDSFSMRNFTNASLFDDTIPVSDGRMEIGKNVPLDQLREAMEDWLRRKSYLPRESKLLLEEIPPVD